jgi:hypothetical protein
VIDDQKGLPVHGELDPVLLGDEFALRGMVGLATGYGTAFAGLQTATDVLKAREAAYAGLAIAHRMVEAARVAAGDTLQVVEYIAHYGLGGLIDVRSATFTAGLDLVKGGEVRLVADLESLGEPYHVEFDFDFEDLARGVENLVRELVPA